ncbi:hypothetical protein HRI96_10225 [Treponema parvum]|uniref:Alginate export domain-containing protein n=1 Tax=Treponema parvum TaxID=138851 RepID=A0A975ID31_9SPIR|nr:hypothetical protein [Treponema parvum]QTQ12540.1 hypothetical protein HRI96_10225 [Treponema parvum]
MKKRIFTAALFALLAGSVFSIDYGAIVSDEVKSTFTEDKKFKDGLKNDFNTSAWLRIPLSEDGLNYFIAEGYYNYRWINSTDKTDDVLDLSLFKAEFVKEFPDKLFGIFKSGVFDFGRFAISDASATVFSQAADGVMANLKTQAAEVTFYGGYTGLLNAKSTLYNMQSSDGIDKKDFYVREDPYAILETAVTLPNIFKSQTLGFEFLGAFDMENSYNRMYFTAVSNGPVKGKVFYILSSTFGVSRLDSDNDWETSNLSKFSLMMYPGFYSSSVSLNGTFASGDKGSLGGFRTFTPATASVAGHTWEDLLKIGPMVTVKPLDALLVTGSLDSFFIATKSADYDGTQWKFTVLWQALSDLQFSGSAAQYIPESGNSTFEFTFKTALSF